MEASLQDMTRSLAQSGMEPWQHAFTHAALEVEIEVVHDEPDDPWFDNDSGIVIVTDDAYQLERSEKLSRVQLLHVIA